MQDEHSRWVSAGGQAVRAWSEDDGQRYVTHARTWAAGGTGSAGTPLESLAPGYALSATPIVAGAGTSTVLGRERRGYDEETSWAVR